MKNQELLKNIGHMYFMIFKGCTIKSDDSPRPPNLPRTVITLIEYYVYSERLSESFPLQPYYSSRPDFSPRRSRRTLFRDPSFAVGSIPPPRFPAPIVRSLKPNCLASDRVLLWTPRASSQDHQARSPQGHRDHALR